MRAGFTACAVRADAVVRPAGSCRARPFWQHGIVDRYCSHRGFLATCACATPSGSAIATVGYGNPAVSTVHLCDRDMPQQSCPGAMQPRPPPRLYVTASRSCTRWRLVSDCPPQSQRPLPPTTARYNPVLRRQPWLGYTHALNLSYRCSAAQPNRSLKRNALAHRQCDSALAHRHYSALTAASGCLHKSRSVAVRGRYCPQHVVISKRGRLSRPPTRLLVG